MTSINKINCLKFIYFQYLTTVIPYHLDSGPPDNQTLQVLIKSKFKFSILFSIGSISKFCLIVVFEF